MTLVGDIAQATAPAAVADWSETIAALAPSRSPRTAELSIGYRIPAPSMALAARVLAVAEPSLAPPSSVRTDGDDPRLVSVESPVDAVAAQVELERRAVGEGSVAVIVPEDLFDAVEARMDSAGIEFGRIGRGAGFEQPVTLVPVRLVKGVEVDSAIIVDPAGMIATEPRGHRALYVALTRSTRRVTLLFSGELPPALRPAREPVT